MGQQQPAIGQDVTALMPKVGDDVTALMSSHAPPPKRPEQILAESDPDYMGGDPNLGQRGLDRLPSIAAGAAAAAVPPLGAWTIPASMAAAGAAGATGAGLRGDSASGAMVEGGKQALMEGAGGLLLKGGRMIAHGLMRGTVPKNIGKEFADVDIAGNMLDRGVVPGSTRSAKRVEGMSSVANAEREAAATTVPTMSRRKVVAGLRPAHQQGVTGKEPEMSKAVLDHMRTSARNIGPEGLSGPQALARKDIKQVQGDAAINNPAAPFGKQLANDERAAIVSHLRETPRMASALDESQTMMAIDQVMKDAAHSNPITRMRIGGPTAGALSPLGLGLSAHGVNQGRKLANPQVLRLLDMIMNSGGQQ